MIAPSDLARRPELLTLPRPRIVLALGMHMGWLCGLLGFLCFLPYPAFAVGNNSAIQMGNVICLLLALPVLVMSWRTRAVHFYLLLVIPLCLASALAAMRGEGDLNLSVKATIANAVSLIALIPVIVHGPRYLMQILSGIAVAVLLHAAVGLWQYYSFQFHELPLAWIYVNPSFLSVQENATVIARWIRRPFGLFPEPSAMTSSLAPFVLLWIANLCGIIRFRVAPARWQSRLFTCAAFAGLLLMILSRSGHAPITLMVALIFSLIWFFRCRASAQSYLVLLLGMGVLLPATIWLASASLSDRVGGKSRLGNSSWEDRAHSLLIGLELMSDSGPQTMAFGMGAGNVSPAILESTGLEAVWSISLVYLYETGIFGCVALLCVAWHLLKVWRASRWSMAFAFILFVWLVGITITTSYSQLLPLWVAMGLLMVWPAICEDPSARPVVRVQPAALQSQFLSGTGRTT